MMSKNIESRIVKLERKTATRGADGIRRRVHREQRDNLVETIAALADGDEAPPSYEVDPVDRSIMDEAYGPEQPVSRDELERSLDDLAFSDTTIFAD